MRLLPATFQTNLPHVTASTFGFSPPGMPFDRTSGVTMGKSRPFFIKEDPQRLSGGSFSTTPVKRNHLVGAGILSNRCSQAFSYALDLHREQFRQSSQIPYISHPMAVAYVAMEYGADEDEAIAALLHDGPEDQGGERILREILKRFGKKVEGIVRGLTVPETLPFDTSGMSRFEKWQAKKRIYLESLQGAPLPVKFIKACDLLCNLRSIQKDYHAEGEGMWEKKFTSAGAKVIEWYYPAVISALKTGDFHYKGLPDLIQELERTLQTIQSERARKTF